MLLEYVTFVNIYFYRRKAWRTQKKYDARMHVSRALWRRGILVAGTALAAALLLCGVTPWGVGLSRDSSVYFDAARNLAKVHQFAVSVPGGKYQPLTHFPPLYPATLTVGLHTGFTARETARALAVVVFAINLLLGMFLVYRLFSNSALMACAYGILWISHPTVLEVHAMAWTEPLCLALSQYALIVWTSRHRAPASLRLPLAMTMFSLAFLSRYAATAGMIAFFVTSFIKDRKHDTRGVSHWFFMMGLGLLPALAWLLRNHWIAGQLTDRQFQWHEAALLPAFRQLSYSFSSWFFPESWYRVTRWIAPLVVGFTFWPKKTTEDHPESKGLRTFFRLYAAIYLGLLIVTIAYLDAETPMDTRLLFPLLPVFWMLFMDRAADLWRAHTSVLIRTGRVLACFFIIGYTWVRVEDTWATIRRLRQDGEQYASRRWQQSALMRYLHTLPQSTILFSNIPEAISIYTAHAAYMMPDPEEANGMFNAIHQKKACLVLFQAPGWPISPIDERLRSREKLNRLVTTEDGAIYGG